jgi:hypothetical protein
MFLLAYCCPTGHAQTGSSVCVLAVLGGTCGLCHFSAQLAALNLLVKDHSATLASLVQTVPHAYRNKHSYESSANEKKPSKGT